jgi:translation elongation factor P/translation initiation factor 5A
VTDRSQPPLGIDASVATAARMYDYWLGGHDNFAADRIAALKIAEGTPEIPAVARANRAFLGRAVRYLAGEAGIRQFLDLGTGLPTKGNVHQVAQAITPGARVVYIDNDPMVAAHSRALKTGQGTAVIQADLRDADLILGHPDTQALIDFSEPLAILFIAVLHFVGDPDARQAVARFTGAAPPGSYLVLSHGRSDPVPRSTVSGAVSYASTANPVTVRTHEEILAFFDGLEIVAPGLVPVQQWRPSADDPADPGAAWLLGGVGQCGPDHVAVPAAPAASSSHVPQPPDSSPATRKPAAAAGRQPSRDIDSTVATSARMYDYWLGGHDNFAADRIAALQISDHMPGAQAAARANRAFLGRAVRFLAGEAGIRQFLDLGTGLPTRGNVHQVAQAITPGARVVYVDNDPMVLAHARALKTGEGTAVIHADLRDADTILGHPDTRRLIDFTQPLAVLFVSVLHFVGGPDAGAAVARFTGAAPPGSYLVLSHVTGEPDPQTAAAGTAVYASTASPITARPRTEILAFFDGLEILEPGLVPVTQWRPDEPGPAEAGHGLAVQGLLGGTGRKPA